MSAARSGAGRRRSSTAAEAAARPRPERRGGTAGRAAFWAVLLAAWAFAWWPQLFAGRVFTGGDWPVEVAYSELSATRWQDTHQRTFWNPYVFLGLPAAASLADSRPQYLPDAALDAIGAWERSPVWLPLLLPLLAHLAGMIAVGMLARALWGAGFGPAAWAAVAWGLLPFQLVPFAFGHRAQLITVGLMPVSLLVVDALFAAASTRRAALIGLGLALIAALQLAAGHPQFTTLSLLVAGAFALERAWRFQALPRLAIALGAVALAVAMSAAVWLPMLRYGAESVRGLEGGVLPEEVRRYSFAVRDFLSFAWPGAVGRSGGTYWGGMNGTDFPQYVGVLVLLLAAFAWRRGGNAAAALLAAVALAACVLSLGFRLGVFYEWIHAHAPFWSRFRVAVAPLIVAQLAAVLLAARGLDALLATPVARRGWAIGAAAALALAAAVYLGAEPLVRGYAALAMNARPGFPAANAQGAAMVALPSLLLTLLTLAAGLGALASAGVARGAATTALLIALTAFDLGLVSVAMLREATVGRETLAAPERSPLAALAALEPEQRASTTDLPLLDSGAEWSRWRLRWTGGAHGTPPRRWSELVASGALREPRVQRALAVRMLTSAPSETLGSRDFGRLPQTDGGRPVWRLRETRPRAWAVPRVALRSGDAEVLAAMASADSFPESVAFTTDPGAAGSYEGSGAARIAWSDDQPDRLALRVESPAPAFVVVADAWFDGWTARLDGAVVPIHRVNHLLRGVATPAGGHDLVMEYEPPGWRSGVRVTRVAAVVWLLLAIVSLLPVRGQRVRRS